MSNSARKLLGATAAAEDIDISDYFSTYLYTGNGSTQTITNGIDLDGEGGLVWIKRRTGTAVSHILVDSERGDGINLQSNSTDAEINNSGYAQSLNSDGFTVYNWATVNGTGDNYASWTFRKAERFFDVVTYTGTGANRTVAHDLGVVPGCIIVKRTDTTGDWQVYHRSNTAAPETDYLVLNSTAATVDDNTRWNDTLPTSTVFSLGTNATVNASGGTYVAYLFAHDPLGPSGDGSDGLIACGSYTGNGSADGPTVTLGWEPQWVLFKKTNSGDSWSIIDNMRGFVSSGGPDPYLFPNSSGAEGTLSPTDIASPTATGFKLATSDAQYNSSGGTYIYIAIRRGPMREPTSGTEVFAVDAAPGVAAKPTFVSGFPVDMGFQKEALSSGDWWLSSRLAGASFLKTNATDAETSFSPVQFDVQNGFYSGTRSTDTYGWMFRRAPGFFDVVAYTGDGVSGRTVSHNLGVAPEMMIVKRRDNIDDWGVYAASYPSAATGYFKLNTTQVFNVQSGAWNNTAPTASVFTVGNNAMVNASGGTYVAYLFASLPGISKVGSYTGNGSSQTISCGFTGGARFVLIKRTNSTGDWYVWDTARGIVAGNDPHLSLNTTAAEVTTDDSIDPDSSGFIVNQDAATNINVSSASYIFYAVS